MNVSRRGDENDSALTSQKNSNRTSESHTTPLERIHSLKALPDNTKETSPHDTQFKTDLRRLGSGERASKENAAPTRKGLALLENIQPGISQSRSKRSSGADLKSVVGKENSISHGKGGSRTSMRSGPVEGINSREFGSKEDVNSKHKVCSDPALNLEKDIVQNADSQTQRKENQQNDLKEELFVCLNKPLPKTPEQDEPSWNSRQPQFNDNAFPLNRSITLSQQLAQSQKEQTQPPLKAQKTYSPEDYQNQHRRAVRMDPPTRKIESMPENYETELVTSSRQVIRTVGTPTSNHERFFYRDMGSARIGNAPRSPNANLGRPRVGEALPDNKRVKYSFNRVQEVEEKRSRGSSFYEAGIAQQRESRYKQNLVFRNDVFGEQAQGVFAQTHHSEKRINMFETSQMVGRLNRSDRVNPHERRDSTQAKHFAERHGSKPFTLRQEIPGQSQAEQTNQEMFMNEVGVSLEGLQSLKFESGKSSAEIIQQRKTFDRLIKERMKKLRDLVDERRSYLQEMEELNGMMEQAIEQHKNDIRQKIEDFDLHMRRCNMPPYSNRHLVSRDLGLVDSNTAPRSKSLGGSLAHSPNIHFFSRKLVTPTPAHTPVQNPAVPKFPRDFNTELFPGFKSKLSPDKIKTLGEQSPISRYTGVNLEYLKGSLRKREHAPEQSKPRAVFKIDLNPKLREGDDTRADLKRVKMGIQRERVNYKNRQSGQNPNQPIDLQSLDTGDNDGSKKATSENQGMRRSKRIRNRKSTAEQKYEDIQPEPLYVHRQTPKRTIRIRDKPHRYEDDEDFVLEGPKRKKKSRKRDRRRKPLSFEDNNPNKVMGISCKCKKSKCLKLYCDCFSSDGMCKPTCRCENCCNNEQFSGLREAVRKEMLQKNPKAFHKKFKKVQKQSDFLHSRGCNCKRTQCLKNYCECFSVGVGCSVLCKCQGCRNKKIKLAPGEAGKYFEKPERRRRKANLVYKFFFNHLRDRGDSEILTRVNSILETEGASLGTAENQNENENQNQNLDMNRLWEMIEELGLKGEFEDFKQKELSGRTERSGRTEGRITPTISPEFDEQILLDEDDGDEEEDGLAQTLAYFKRLRKE